MDLWGTELVFEVPAGTYHTRVYIVSSTYPLSFFLLTWFQLIFLRGPVVCI